MGNVLPEPVTYSQVVKLLKRTDRTVVMAKPGEPVMCTIPGGFVIMTISGDGALLSVSTQHLEMPLARKDTLKLYEWMANFNATSTFAIASADIMYDLEIAFPTFSYWFAIEHGATAAQLEAWILPCLNEQEQGLQELLRYLHVSV